MSFFAVSHGDIWMLIQMVMERTRSALLGSGDDEIQPLYLMAS
jgi:hypothetical protein